jgi:isoleucyl-tRNA synthetase
MTRWMAPILSFTAEEIWQLLPGKRGEFVQTDSWYDGLPQSTQDSAYDDTYWAQVLQIRDEVNRVLEKARRDEVVGATLQADVTLFVSELLHDVLSLLKDELRFVLITSKVDIQPFADKTEQAVATEIEGLWVEVQASQGQKCERCWHYSNDVGTDEDNSSLCGRCVTNIEGQGETRYYA